MSSIDYISKTANDLAHKYQTRDPYEICGALGVRVRLKDLGTGIKAYYFYQSHIRSIVLNWRVCESVRRILAAHELGHDRLHKEIALLKGFQELDLFCKAQPTEYEANLFAAELLVDDTALLGLLNDRERSFFDVAVELGVPAALLDFKFRILKYKGYRIEPVYIANGDFLRNEMDGCFNSDKDDYC